jgi:hypothetical protein
METEQASMKSQMDLQHALTDHAQTMTDRMLAMSEHRPMMSASMDMPMKKDEQKE